MIEEVRPDSSHYQRVVELGNANSATLGFLPYAVFNQAAAEGRVLACVEDGEVKGYALYARRVRTGDISLTHLCVDQNQRSRGIARELVEAIVERYPNRAGIRLSCRKDYDADAMWPHLGFRRLGEKPGRSRAGLPLVAWSRPIAAFPLFDELEQDDARIVVAVDTNVLIDILEQRDFPASLALTADWVTEAVELVVTAQSHAELSDRLPRGEEFESELRKFRTLEPSETAWRATLRSLQDDQVVARVREGDLRVVAQASADDVEYVVSRDEGLLRRATRIERLTGLDLVGPDDFLLRLQELGGEHERQTRSIAVSGLSVSPVSEMPSNTALSAYCHEHLDERPADLRQRLSVVTAHPSGRIEQLASEDGEPLALGAMYRDGDLVTVTALRSTPGALSNAAARQMVHHIRTIVSADGPATIVVDDQTRSPVDRALRDEGFRAEGSAWKAAVQIGVLGPGDRLPLELERIGWDRLSGHLVRDFEQYAWPLKIFTGGVTSYMVPIKPEYARVILGYEEPQLRLFEQHRRAAVARHNVYYMSPRRFVEAPARIIWWVSGGGSLGGMRAVSWLDEVETGDPRRLHRRYRNFGVLDENQVIGTAKQSKQSGRPEATAMVFSQTEMFTEPVSIARSREICDSMKQNSYFITTRRIEENTIRELYEEGMRPQ